MVIESLNPEGTDNYPGLQIADPSAVFPDKLFDREWAHAIMERSLSAVQSSFEKAGKGAQFEVLKPWLVGDTENLSQSDAAAKLGMSAVAIKMTIHRLRRDFRAAVEAETRRKHRDTQSNRFANRRLMLRARAAFSKSLESKTNPRLIPDTVYPNYSSLV